MACDPIVSPDRSGKDYFNKLDSLWKDVDGLTSLTECTCEAFIKLKDHSNLVKLMQEESLQRNGSLSSLQSSQSLSKSQSTTFNSHTIEKCYKLIGYPKDFKPRNESNNQNSCNKIFFANSTTTTSGSTVTSNLSNYVGDFELHRLTKEQYIKILQLIGNRQLNEEASASANMACTCLFQVFNSSVNFQKWIVDSGADQHMIVSDSLLHDIVDVSKLDLLVSYPNGTLTKIEKICNMNLSNSLTLFDVFVVPDFNVNLLFVHKVYKDSNYEIVFNEHSCKIQGLQSREMVGNGRESGGIYYINSVPSSNSSSVNNSTSICCVSKLIWHNKLGHPSDQALSSLKNKLKFGNEVLPPCDICHKAKQTRESFPVSQFVTSKLGELVHLDVWGFYRVTTTKGFSYFLTILDDYTKETWVYLLKSKDELGVKIKIVRSDNGIEFLNHIMIQLMESKGYKVLSLDSNLVFVFRDIKFYESVFPFKLKSSSLTDKSNVPLSDLFSYDESLHSSTFLDNTNLEYFRSVHQSDGTSADQDLDETCPSDVSNQTGEAHVPSSGVMFPNSSTLTEENDSININPFDGQSSRVTRSGRNVHMPVRFSGYVVEGKLKYGIERFVNYSTLNSENLFFCC
ncbi:uncharacterized protein LOC128132492 [Lactuca sativa]|uniref:uncharacterized protein LOC128132492 n=1 Tax=Lactuca sativa TaxID=4236 RepID=UPI0022B033D6|nr:uncharacterized protein LOC128132492 [Lactuca sativa]